MILSISIILAIIVVNFAPRYIKNEENNLISTCNEIELDRVYSKNYALGAILIASPQILLTFLPIGLLYQCVFLMLGIASYFDFKRNWIPDPVIFITSIVNFLYILNSHELSFKVVCINAFIFTLPYAVLNALSYVFHRKLIFYSGDIYIIISLSFSVLPIIGIITNSLSLFMALLFMLVTKKREIPYIPFLFASFLTSSVLMS